MAEDLSKKVYRSYDELPLFMTPRQASVAMGLARNTAYDLIKTGHLDAVRVGNRLIVTKEALKHFFDREK